MGVTEPSLRRFIEEQIAAGRHATADEVVEAALAYYRDAQAELDEHYAMVRREAERGIADMAAGRYLVIESADQLHVLLQQHLDQLEEEMQREGAVREST